MKKRNFYPKSADINKKEKIILAALIIALFGIIIYSEYSSGRNLTASTGMAVSCEFPKHIVNNKCVDCRIGHNEDCGGGSGYCSPENRCVQCLSDEHCLGGRHCVRYRCAACGNDFQCNITKDERCAKNICIPRKNVGEQCDINDDCRRRSCSQKNPERQSVCESRVKCSDERLCMNENEYCSFDGTCRAK